MDNAQILEKANQVVKDKKFTSITRPKKIGVACFLIVNCGSGLAIYGAYNSDNYYAEYNGTLMKLN